MNKRLKKFLIAIGIMLIILLLGTMAYANSYKQKIDKEIVNIESKQEKIHNIADEVRELNLDNETEIITSLKRAWHNFDSQKQLLIEKREKLDNILNFNIFEISAYCGENYHHICNNGNARTTATGTVPTAGRTVAVDPNVIPYGSTVIIGGNEYIAEDTGGAIKGNKIDIFFNTHAEALQWGRRNMEVYIVRN